MNKLKLLSTKGSKYVVMCIKGVLVLNIKMLKAIENRCNAQIKH